MARQLTLVIHSLGGGGAERTLAAMANHWAHEGYQVTLVTLAPQDADAYELSTSVTRVCLDGMQASSNILLAVINNVRRLIRLRRAIRHAAGDTVISFTDKMNILTLLACFGLGKRAVICERVDPRQHEIGRSWALLRRRTYPLCHRLVVQTEAVRNYFQPFVSDAKIRVLANAVPTIATARAAHLPRERWVVAMGRLEVQKGFDLLIDAFSHIAAKHPDWKLKILGDGSRRTVLADQIRALGLEQSVELCGWVKAPEAFLSKAELFVLSSRYEGFPNALLEAMAAGVPAISFDCDSGPSEIIRHEVDGLLVPPNSVQQLADAIERLILNARERQAFAERAPDVTHRFSNERFYQRWEAILNPALEDCVGKHET